MIEDQVRRNMEMFERAFSMFTPFQRPDGTPSSAGAAATETNSEPGATGDIDALKRQLADVQQQLNKMSDKDKP